MIWLHVGLPKTGTSSIQAALRLVTHRSRLAVWTIGDHPPPLSPQWSELIRSRASAGDVVVSDETLLGDPSDGYPYVPVHLDRLKSALAHLDVTVVLGLRRQPDWVASVYLQTLHQGATWSDDEYYERIRATGHLSWARTVADLESALDPWPLRVLVHDPSRDSVLDFFSLCGLERPPDVGAPIRENVSISAAQAPIVRMLNSQMSPDVKNKVRQFMQQVSGPASRSEASALSPAVRASIDADYSHEWPLLLNDLARSGRLAPGLDPVALACWPEDNRPYIGTGLGDPRVADEAIRIMSLAIDLVALPGEPTAFSRLRYKLRSNPADLPAAVLRSLRRRS